MGFDDDSLTTVLFKEPSESGTLKGFGLGVSDAFLIVGEQSNAAVETEGALQIDLSARSGSFIAKNLKKPFIEDESLLVLSKGSGQTVYTQNEKALQNFVTRFEDTTNNIRRMFSTAPQNLLLSLELSNSVVTQQLTQLRLEQVVAWETLFLSD